MITSDIIQAIGKDFRFTTHLLHLDESGERTYFILTSEKSIIRVDDASQCIPLVYLPSTEISPDVIEYFESQNIKIVRCPTT